MMQQDLNHTQNTTGGWHPARGAAPISPSELEENDLSLDGKTLPESERDIKGLSKAFLTERSYETFQKLGVELLNVPEFPEDLKKEILDILNKPRALHDRALLTEALTSYHGLTSRLPDKSSAAQWSQDRSKHHNLYAILGIMCALMRLVDTDYTLTQRIISTEFQGEKEAIRKDLRERLLDRYDKTLFPPHDEMLLALKLEFSDKNPLAVTTMLKGYLVPLFELESQVKVGWLKQIFTEETYSETPVNSVKDLDDGELSPRHTHYLRHFLKYYQDKGVLPLNQIPVKEVIDGEFLTSVLRASASTRDKIIFLHAAALAATSVSQSAFAILPEFSDAFCEQGDSKLIGADKLLDAMANHNCGRWTTKNLDSYLTVVITTLLDRCSKVDNRPLFMVAMQGVNDLIAQANNYRAEFKADLKKFVVVLSDKAISGKDQRYI